MENIFNKELLYRIISVLIFIPIVILPLFYSNYLTLIIYLLITSIILLEIHLMKKKVKNLLIFNIYSFVSTSSFLLFLFLFITEKLDDFSIITVIMVIWLFDTFSFLGGKIIGGAKLMPKISYGKTYSGLLSGILITILCVELALSKIDISNKISTYYVLIIIFLSFVGDMLVSLLKRKASIKDSGSIMPGHGGLLDRFDSFILVFFIICLLNLI